MSVFDDLPAGAQNRRDAHSTRLPAACRCGSVRRALEAWGTPWSCGDQTELLPFFAADARYRDVGSDLTFNGREEIARFYRFMLRFAPDSEIRFDSAHGDRSGFAAHWTWAGTGAGPLRVRDELFPATADHSASRAAA